MDDALMSMFWAGLAAGIAIGMAIFGAIGAAWWWWPQHPELPDDDEPDDGFRCTADEPACVPLPGWDATAPPPCDSFAWIGQSFAHCERCGKPFWEHTYDEVPGDIPFGEPNKRLLTAEEKAKCRAKWDGADA